MMMVSKKKMSLADWRAKQVRQLELPSGLTVTLRKVTLTDMALTGKLPNSVMAMASEAAKSGVDTLDLKAVAENIGEFNEMLDTMVQVCLVEPKIGAEADEEHITLAEMSTDDKMSIFNALNEGAEQLHRFRDGEDEPAAGARRGRGVRKAAERDPGTDGLVDGVSV